MIIRPSLCWAAAAFTLSSIGFSQSKFDLDNYEPPLVDAPVYDAQGVPLAGSIYRAELWGGATSDALTPLVLIDQGFSRDMAPFSTRGYFDSIASSDNLCVLDVPPGGFAWLQVRAWDTRLGATWEAVAAAGMGGYGESPLLYAKGGDPTSVPPQLPGFLIGLQSFSLRPVPEPSTWLIGSLGLIGIWWKMRGKRKSGCPK